MVVFSNRMCWEKKKVKHSHLRIKGHKGRETKWNDFLEQTISVLNVLRQKKKRWITKDAFGKHLSFRWAAIIMGWIREGNCVKKVNEKHYDCTCHRKANSHRKKCRIDFFHWPSALGCKREANLGAFSLSFSQKESQVLGKLCFNLSSFRHHFQNYTAIENQSARWGSTSGSLCCCWRLWLGSLRSLRREEEQSKDKLSLMNKTSFSSQGKQRIKIGRS